MNNHTAALAEALREALDALALFSDSNNSCADAEMTATAALAAYEAASTAAPAHGLAHTPEPWRADGQTVCAGHKCIRTQMVWGNGADFEESAAESIANARRIVACVNACEGLSTAALETAGERPVQALVHAAINTNRYAQEQDAGEGELFEAVRALDEDPA